MKRYKLKAKQKSNQRKRARNLLEYKTIRLFLPKTKFFLGPWETDLRARPIGPWHWLFGGAFSRRTSRTLVQKFVRSRYGHFHFHREGCYLKITYL